ncbi:MAG: hypothetical protein O3A20_03430 [Planctomycetota bacterium]|nr:hypothetical protein [Planctomycetota bacterium]
MKLIATLTAASASILLAGAIQAQQCVDQNAPTNNACMAGFGQTDLAQSFQTQGAANISGAGIYCGNYGSTETLSIELWSDLPNAPGAVLLASGTGQASPNSYFDVSWPPVNITANTTYYLVFGNTATLCYDGDISNQYPYGQVYANPGFGGFPNYDYTFHTFTSCGPALSKTGTCPGSVRLDVTGATPNSNIALLYGNAGVFVKNGNPCSGLVLGIANPTLAAMLPSNGSGNATLAFNAPPAACGRTVQAVDVASCVATNTIIL